MSCVRFSILCRVDLFLLLVCIYKVSNYIIDLWILYHSVFIQVISLWLIFFNSSICYLESTKWWEIIDERYSLVSLRTSLSIILKYVQFKTCTYVCFWKLSMMCLQSICYYWLRWLKIIYWEKYWKWKLMCFDHYVWVA